MKKIENYLEKVEREINQGQVKVEPAFKQSSVAKFLIEKPVKAKPYEFALPSTDINISSPDSSFW